MTSPSPLILKIFASGVCDPVEVIATSNTAFDKVRAFLQTPVSQPPGPDTIQSLLARFIPVPEAPKLDHVDIANMMATAKALQVEPKRVASIRYDHDRIFLTPVRDEETTIIASKAGASFDKSQNAWTIDLAETSASGVHDLLNYLDVAYIQAHGDEFATLTRRPSKAQSHKFTIPIAVIDADKDDLDDFSQSDPQFKSVDLFEKKLFPILPKLLHARENDFVFEAAYQVFDPNYGKNPLDVIASVARECGLPCFAWVRGITVVQPTPLIWDDQPGACTEWCASLISNDPNDNHGALNRLALGYRNRWAEDEILPSSGRGKWTVRIDDADDDLRVEYSHDGQDPNPVPFIDIARKATIFRYFEQLQPDDDDD